MITRLVPRLAMLVVLVAAFASGSASVAAQVTPPLPTSGDVTVNATLNTTLTLVLSSSTANFGVVSPGGNPVVTLNDPASGSSYYLAVGPVVTVLSNAPWSGTLNATDVVPASTTLTIASNDVRYSQYTVDASITAVTPLLTGTSLNGIGADVSVPATYEEAGDMTPITPGNQTFRQTTGAGLHSSLQVYSLNVTPGDTVVTGSTLGLNTINNVEFNLKYSATQGS